MIRPTPWYKQKTTWVSVAGVLMVGAALSSAHLDVPKLLVALAALAGNLGSLFARDGALVDASKLDALAIPIAVTDLAIAPRDDPGERNGPMAGFDIFKALGQNGQTDLFKNMLHFLTKPAAKLAFAEILKNHTTDNGMRDQGLILAKAAAAMQRNDRDSAADALAEFTAAIKLD